MSDFRKQIEEDIRQYQEKRPEVDELKKDEWAFNYWVLDKFFYEDEDMILNRIIDYRDRGIDCYEWYEDTKELFIIQNKWFSTTKLQTEYVKNNLLISPITILEQGNYSHCPELQKIFDQNKNDPKFTVRFQIFVTNDKRNKEVDDAIKQYNAEHENYFAEIFYLADIEEKWYGEPREVRKDLKSYVESVNGGTILNVNNEAYHLDNDVDAKYVYTPISCLYYMVKTAKEKGYSLFDKNIREYLGNKGINKSIYHTLRDKDDRKNFFYYNNGITMICKKIGSICNCNESDSFVKTNPHSNVFFSVQSPQIVNGCQTVNSIFEALSSYDDDDIETEFKDTFVMLKVLEVDSENEAEKDLAKNIVTYNNSQNAINEKNFVAVNQKFIRLQSEFEKKGFLLLAKQSDKNQFSIKYKQKGDLAKLRGRSLERLDRFGLSDLKKLSDLHIPLERLLQVVLAFKEGGLSAYTNKKDVLKVDTKTYETVVNFITSGNVTTEVLLDMWALFKRSEKEKNANKAKEGKHAAPITFYLIDAFAKYECEDRGTKLITSMLDSKEKVDSLIKKYKWVTKRYTKEMDEEKNLDYTRMIKEEVDYSLIEKLTDMWEDM